MPDKFIHLHNHSEYSLLDGLPKIPDLVRRAKALDMSAIALTGHGVMYGAIEFYNPGRAEGLKAIVGMETYVVNGDHRRKDTKVDRENHHLVLLAADIQGYKNLIQITTSAHLAGFYYRPRIGKETLARYRAGLICLSGCAKSEVGQLLIYRNYSAAKDTALWYQSVFGDRYYLEIQRHQFRDYVSSTTDPKILENLHHMQKTEDAWVAGVTQLSRDLGIRLVATNDTHYTDQKDAFAQDVLVCISTGKTVAE